jgi:hypothetical protein
VPHVPRCERDDTSEARHERRKKNAIRGGLSRLERYPRSLDEKRALVAIEQDCAQAPCDEKHSEQQPRCAPAHPPGWNKQQDSEERDIAN